MDLSAFFGFRKKILDLDLDQENKLDLFVGKFCRIVARFKKSLQEHGKSLIFLSFLEGVPLL